MKYFFLIAILIWQASAGLSTNGIYRVYHSRDLVAWENLGETKSTNFFVEPNGGNNFYRVTAFDNWLESEPSNIASKKQVRVAITK